MGCFVSRYMVKCANCHRHGQLSCARLPLAGVQVILPALQPAQLAGPALPPSVPPVASAAVVPGVPDSREGSVADTYSSWSGLGSDSGDESAASSGPVPQPTLVGSSSSSSTSSDSTTSSFARLFGPPSQPAPPQPVLPQPAPWSLFHGARRR